MKGKGKKENSTGVGSKTVFSVQNVISSTFDRKRDMSICRDMSGNIVEKHRKWESPLKGERKCDAKWSNKEDQPKLQNHSFDERFSLRKRDFSTVSPPVAPFLTFPSNRTW